MADAASDSMHKLPFDAARLDRLLDERGIDVLLVTSKHNIQYLLGGYRFFFFDYMDAIGISRYLPILIYPKGKPENAVYIGNRLEVFEKQLDRFWTPVAEMAVRAVPTRCRLRSSMLISSSARMAGSASSRLFYPRIVLISCAPTWETVRSSMPNGRWNC